MYPISDLTAFCRRTTGDVPPKLVGASTTVVGSKMYLYGGRLVSERRMVSDIYMFDLETFNWECLPQSPEDDIPQARYFHSADAWRNHLIIFGGMAIKPQSDNPEDLCVLNDVRLFDLTTGHWLPATATQDDPSPFTPNARYAHLSSVTADRLFIIGGQDLANVWLDDVYIYDLVKKKWMARREYTKHCGTYRSVAVTADMRVRLPQEESRAGQSSSSTLGTAGSRFKSTNATPTTPITPPESLIHLPYSAPPTDDYPCDIYLFSNYNFTDVQRELEVFSPLSDGDFTVSDRSASMTGTSFPPGLRFPTGAILGTNFIVAGTYLSQTYQSFSIWSLDLVSMTWSRIDPGSALATGSWFRSCLWPSVNKLLVFGNRHGNLVEDYNRRLLSWDHVTCIDLEAFGIYQPPRLLLDVPAQELGLAAFEDGVLTDFEIICDDGRKIKCSRKLLEQRWPWFKEERRLFVEAAARATQSQPNIPQDGHDGQDPRPDPRLTPRAFHLSEPYPITLALVQYMYSMALITPLQHAPAVLSQLLLLSSTYKLEHLQSLVKHAMHRALSYATSVGIYGVSTLCSCRSLQIRALRVVMAYSQKRPAGSRARTDKDAPSSGGSASANGQDAGGGGGSLQPPAAARPRGMSDASYLRGLSEGTGFGANGGYRNAILHKSMTAVGRAPSSSTAVQRPRAMSEVLPLRTELQTVREDAAERSDSPQETLRSHSPAGTPRQRLSSVIEAAEPTSVPSAHAHRHSHHTRSSSVVSIATHQDLCAMADLMSSDPEPSTPPASASPSSVAASVAPLLPATRSRANSLLDIYRITEQQTLARQASSSSLSIRPTTSSSQAESDSDYFSDGFGESAVYSPMRAAYPAFHLPLSPPRRTANWDDDSVPSLKTSTSISSLSTPSLSRTSSFHRSPPISPTSLSLATPSDGVSVSTQDIHLSELGEDGQYGAHASLPPTPATSSFSGHSHTDETAPVHLPPFTSSVRELEYRRKDTTSPATIVPTANSPESETPGSTRSPTKSLRPGAFIRLFTRDGKKQQSDGDFERYVALNGSGLNLNMAKADAMKKRRAGNKDRAGSAVEKLRSALEGTRAREQSIADYAFLSS